MSGGGLEAALLAVHDAGDIRKLAALYRRAAEAAPDNAAASFYLTHALVFALEAGDPSATSLHARLVALGCDTAATVI